MSAPVARVFCGLFLLQDEELLVRSSGEAWESVSQFLGGLEGREVSISAHHLPSDPPNPEVPGMGSCHWNGHCPCGHSEDPHLMFRADFKGVLERAVDGIVGVSGEPLRLNHYMPGHLGRIVVLAEGFVDPDSSPEDLLDEVSGLLEIVSSLRDAVKENSG